MTGQMLEITGYAVCGISVLLLIVSEIHLRRKKNRIIKAVYDEMDGKTE